MASSIMTRARSGSIGLAVIAGIAFAPASAWAEGKPSESEPAPVASQGGVLVDGGTVSNTTTIDVSADGGAAIADASGGDDNLAVAAADVEDRERNRGDNGNDRNDRNRDNNGNGNGNGNGNNNGRGDNDRGDNGNGDGGRGNGGNGGGDNGNGGNAVAGNGGNAGAGGAGGAGGIGDLAIGGALADLGLGTLADDGVGAVGVGLTGDTAAAGNGGVADASASGGAVSIGDVNSGGNVGNAISVGDTIAAPVGVDRSVVPARIGAAATIKVVDKAVAVAPVAAKPGQSAAPRNAVVLVQDRDVRSADAGGTPTVSALPSTGTGFARGETSLLLIAAAIAGLMAFGLRRRLT